MLTQATIKTIRATLEEEALQLKRKIELYVKLNETGQITRGEIPIWEKAQARLVEVEAARVEVLALAQGAWLPLADGEYDCKTSLNPQVGVWVYGAGERISVSTTDYEIYADLPETIRLCQLVPQEGVDFPDSPGWWGGKSPTRQFVVWWTEFEVKGDFLWVRWGDDDHAVSYLLDAFKRDYHDITWYKLHMPWDAARG